MVSCTCKMPLPGQQDDIAAARRQRLRGEQQREFLFDALGMVGERRRGRPAHSKPRVPVPGAAQGVAAPLQPSLARPAPSRA